MHVCINNAKALILASEGAEQLGAEGSYTAREMRLPFSEDEDKRLVALVQKHGVPKHGGAHSGKKARLRSRARGVKLIFSPPAQLPYPREVGRFRAFVAPTDRASYLVNHFLIIHLCVEDGHPKPNKNIAYR